MGKLFDTWENKSVKKVPVDPPLIKIELSNSTFGTKIAKCTNSGVIRFLSKTVINFIDIEILYSVISYLNYYRNTNC